MARISCQRGEGRLGFIITLAVFITAAFVAFKVLPVRINAYQFRDTLRDEARYASAHHEDGKVKKRILERANSLSIPLDPDNLSIKRNKTEVVISVRYEQPINLKLTTYTFRFDEQQKAPIF